MNLELSVEIEHKLAIAAPLITATAVCINGELLACERQP